MATNDESLHLLSCSPRDLEREACDRIAMLVVRCIQAQSGLKGRALTDAERDMRRAQSDALACLRTLVLGADRGKAHAVDDTAAANGGKCE